MPRAKAEYIVQIFDDNPTYHATELEKLYSKDWVDTIWTNKQVNNDGQTPVPVTKAKAKLALKDARTQWPDESYMIVKVKNIS